jgi:type IV secretory pathway component VirB8
MDRIRHMLKSKQGAKCLFVYFFEILLQKVQNIIILLQLDTKEEKSSVFYCQQQHHHHFKVPVFKV